MQQIYPTATPKPYECTLHPGDAIYFPNQWWHATINLDRYTAFISTFTTEHNYEAASDVAKQRSPSAAAADGATTSISDSRSQWRRTSTSKGSTPPENDIGWRQMESHEDETANKFDQEL